MTDSGTGYQWFATNSNVNELFIVIASDGPPLRYGTKALVTMEELYQRIGDDHGPPSNSELYCVMQGIDTEYRYGLFFGDDEVLDLIQEVDELTSWRENIDGLEKNIEREQELEEKARQLHDLAKQFNKKANKRDIVL